LRRDWPCRGQVPVSVATAFGGKAVVPADTLVALARDDERASRKAAARLLLRHGYERVGEGRRVTGSIPVGSIHKAPTHALLRVRGVTPGRRSDTLNGRVWKPLVE
jgi:hypothetical protein